MLITELKQAYATLSQERKDSIVYTWIHHKKVVEMAKANALYVDVEYHDLDKITMRLLTSLSDKTISAIHKKRPHHKRLRLDDLFESIIDFEASSYTKIDKPQNAWGTLDKLECFKDEWLRHNAETCIKALGYATYPINRQITQAEYDAMVANVDLDEMFVTIADFLQHAWNC